MCWKNGTFSVHSYAMTIDVSKFEKNGNVCGLFQTTADSLRHAGGTIVEVCNLQVY